MKKQKILVIGANSLVGSNIYQSLKGKKYEVTGTFNNLRERGLKKLDITKYSQLEKAISEENPDIIINSAAITTTEICNSKQQDSFNVNVIGSKNIAEICKQKNKKLVYISSVRVLDSTKTEPHKENENPILIPNDWYIMTKASSEAFTQSILPNAIIIRIAHAYGHKANNPRIMGGDFFRFAYDSLKNKKVVLAYKGTKSNQTLLSDIGNATAKLIEIGYEGRINIGGEGIEVDAFFRKMKEIFKLPGEIVYKDICENRLLDLTKMHKLGIKMVSIEEGLKNLSKYYKL